MTCLLVLAWFMMADPTADSPDLVGNNDPRRPEIFRGIEEYLEKRIETDGIPGMSASVVIDGKLAWSKGFGKADLENDVHATDETVYRFASITRTITAVAVLQLIERGQLALNASVRDFVPEFEVDQRVTVAHLLPHLGGVRTVRSHEEFMNRKPYRRLVDTLHAFRKDPLVAEPGTKFLNTPLGYNLLGLLTERVSGTEYGVFLQENVFLPAGMNSAGVEDPLRIVAHRARGYLKRKDGSLRNSVYVDTSFLKAAEGIEGSVADLGRFAAALLDHRLLSEPYRKLMMTAHKTSGGDETHYGMGCFVRTWKGYTITGHGGWQPRVSSFLLMFPDSKMAIAAVANLEQADVRSMCMDIAERLLQGGDNP